MRAVAFVAAVALAGCGGGGGAADVAAPKQDAVSERKAEKDAKGLVREIYDTLSRSTNTDSLMALLAEPLVVYGPRRTDAHATRTDALVAMRAILDDRGKDKSPSVSSGGLTVVASPGGLSAFAVDVVDVEGSPMAVTAVLVNDDDFWRVIAADLARTPPEKTIRSQLEKDAIVPPALEAPAKSAGAADGAASHFKRGLGDPSVWAADLSSTSDAVVVGAAADSVTRGKKAIEKLWKKRTKASVRYAPAGDLASGTTPDGQLAWVTIPAVQFADEADPLPLRLFGVYQRAGGSWKLVALHESLAIDEPGIGANFRKLAAPDAKAAEPPPPPPASDDGDKPKKKKKKKKQKKSRED